MEQKTVKLAILPMWQPYASLTLHNNPKTGLPWKQWETRPVKPPKTILGKTILIHACNTWNKELAKLYHSKPFSDACDTFSGNYLLTDRKPDKFMPFGAIIGSWEVEYFAEIQIQSHNLRYPVKIEMPEDKGVWLFEREAPEIYFGDYRAGRWGWKIKNPRLLKEPIPFKANQGINYIEINSQRLQYI